MFLDCIQIVPQIDIFVRSGGIYFDDGTVGGPHSGGMGDTNRTWSSRSGAATDAYDLNFNAADVHPSWGPRNRYHGASAAAEYERDDHKRPPLPIPPECGTPTEPALR